MEGDEITGTAILARASGVIIDRIRIKMADESSFTIGFEDQDTSMIAINIEGCGGISFSAEALPQVIRAMQWLNSDQ